MGIVIDQLNDVGCIEKNISLHNLKLKLILHKKNIVFFYMALLSTLKEFFLKVNQMCVELN